MIGERLRIACEATGLGTWDVDVNSGERVWSPEFLRLLGLHQATKPDPLLFLDLIHPDDRERAIRELDVSEDGDGPARVSVFRLRSPEGDDRWVEARERTFLDAGGRKLRRIGTLQDITDRKRSEHRTWLAAHTDPLTELANRTLFKARLEYGIETVAAGACVGLLLIDLDRFKEINDTAGHEAGDAVLRGVAKRLADLVPSAATVARLGGDEFGVVVPDMPSAASVADLAAELAIELRRPVTHAGREFDCSASIGWTAYPDHDPLTTDVMRHADLALYACKAAGRGRSMAYDPAMRRRSEIRLAALGRVRDALARDAVRSTYQPKISLETGTIAGFEAIVQWTESGRFAELAPIDQALLDPELSVALGDRMLEGVVRDMHRWTDAGIPFGTVALNVAPHQLQRGGLAERILAALASARVDPALLEIEVMESAFVAVAVDVVGSTMETLQQAGIAITIDEFGTGHASLVNLNRHPVTTLKIDRSLVSSLEGRLEFGAVTAAFVGLAHSMGVKVAAGDVETPLQLKRLAEAGCDLAQGHLIAAPMDGQNVPRFLADWGGRIGSSTDTICELIARYPPSEPVRAHRTGRDPFTSSRIRPCGNPNATKAWDRCRRGS